MTNPSQIFHILVAVRNSFSPAVRRNGVDLSVDDNTTTLNVYQQWLSLCVDLGYLHPGIDIVPVQSLWHDIASTDVLQLNNTFAECLHSVRTKTFKGFKHLCLQVSPLLYSLIEADVDRTKQGDVYSAKRLVQLFSYTSRLSLNDIDLTQQLLSDYMDTERQMASHFPDQTIQRLNKIIRRWVGAFVPEDLVPHHGPGGVAGLGRCSLEDKYKDLSRDELLSYAFRDPIEHDSPIHTHLSRISQTIFVPKSYKTFRTISMEPTSLQYCQQGVWGGIDHQVAKSRYLRSHIGFHDQTRNQELAREGSISRNYATIDLSAASDSVSYALVKGLFRGTWLYRYLITTRSNQTLLPDGSVIDLKKFAPMGSALCFPIETIIFASICELVTREHRISGKYSVFGDDIIVPTDCVEHTINILESLGFKVNRSKSFYDPSCWFRESCGGEYCDGFDVTPMKVSRSYSSQEQDVRITRLISLANNAYDRNFENLRYFFLKELEASGYKALFASTSLKSDSYSNYKLPKRWNKDLQRIECKASSLVSKYSKKSLGSQNEEIRYRHWLESCNNRYSIGDGFESVICKSSVYIQDTWRSKDYDVLDQNFIDLQLRRGKSPTSIKSKGGWSL